MRTLHPDRVGTSPDNRAMAAAFATLSQLFGAPSQGGCRPPDGPPEDAPAAADDGDDHPPPDVAAASTAPLTPSPEVLASGTRRIILSESQEIILHQHLDVMGYEQPLNGARSAIWNRLRAMTPVDLRRTKRQRTGPGPSTWY